MELKFVRLPLKNFCVASYRASYSDCSPEESELAQKHSAHAPELTCDAKSLYWNK